MMWAGQAQKDSDIVPSTFSSAHVPLSLTNEKDKGREYSWQPSACACSTWGIGCRDPRKRDLGLKPALSLLICETVMNLAKSV